MRPAPGFAPVRGRCPRCGSWTTARLMPAGADGRRDRIDAHSPVTRAAAEASGTVYGEQCPASGAVVADW